MLCQHNSNFYDLSDYHAFLINNIASENKSRIIESAQGSFANLSVNNTVDFASALNSDLPLGNIYSTNENLFPNTSM